MLSVQAPGCAGMERLGAPGGAAPPPDRPRLRREPLDHRHRDELVREQQQQLEALQREVGRLLEQQARMRSATAADLLGLPPPIQLPDGEHGADAHLQLRVAYQQAELTRSCVQPPPNKSVSDVPEWASGGGMPTRRTAPGKKDGFVQKAVRYLRGATGGSRAPSSLVQQLGADEAAAHRLQRDLETLRRPPAPPSANAPCVMVPLPPPSPSSSLVPPAAPSPTGDV